MTRALSILLLVACPGVASANMGRPSWGGSLTGEPAGIPDVAIQHEELDLDLRPIPAGERARIAATYHLDNRGAAASLALVFASGERSIVEFQIQLDGASTAVSEVHRLDGPLPPSWRAPATTPLPGGGAADYDLWELRRDGAGDNAFGFTLAIPPGAHTLAITYQAEPLHQHRGGVTTLHQLAYVLAPARTWASFGGLEVSVHVPPGWEAAVSPALARTGDTLHGAFAQLPADAIALSIQAPAPWFRPLQLVLGLVVLAVGLGGGFVVAAWARRRARPESIHPSLTRALGRGFVWAAVFTTVGILAIVAPTWTIPDGQQDAYRGYAEVAYGALVLLVALVLWLIGAVVAWWVDRRIVRAALTARVAALDVAP